MIFGHIFLGQRICEHVALQAAQVMPSRKEDGQTKTQKRFGLKCQNRIAPAAMSMNGMLKGLKIHFAVKSPEKTSLIEGVNCVLRRRVNRLVRKPVAFSKLFVNHMGSVRYFSESLQSVGLRQNFRKTWDYRLFYNLTAIAPPVFNINNIGKKSDASKPNFLLRNKTFFTASSSKSPAKTSLENGCF
jgi:hypothetical protein